MIGTISTINVVNGRGYILKAGGAELVFLETDVAWGVDFVSLNGRVYFEESFTDRQPDNAQYHAANVRPLG